MGRSESETSKFDNSYDHTEEEDTVETREWPKRTVEWTEDNTAYLSVPFTWNLPEVYSRCVWYRTILRCAQN